MKVRSALVQYMTTAGALVASVDQDHIVSVDQDHICTNSFPNPQSEFANFEPVTQRAASIYHGAVVA